MRFMQLNSLYQEIILQKENLFLWAPVFLACGIGAYFSLAVEPPLLLGILAVGILAAAWVLFKERAGAVFLIFFLVAAGFLAAQVRTVFIDAPLLEKKLGPVEVTGRIAAIEDLGEEEGLGAKLVLENLAIEKLPPGKMPARIRLRVREDKNLVVGQRVKVLAEVLPTSPPVLPGAFDFQRYLYFQRIGAVGFVYRILDVSADTGSWWSIWAENLRHRVDQIIEANLPEAQSPTAIALLTGRQTAINRGDKEAMRASGLAHLLSISGLHIGLFSAVIFFAVRLVLVLIPGVALRYPVKKYAALIAFAGACFYTVLAGGDIPVVRSLIMTGAVLLAIVLDRSPISLRLVAFAAFCVLLCFPESLLSASFQMSFGAVTALVMFYDWLRPWWSAAYSQAGILRRAALYFASVCLTTLIASAATTPFALFHFQQTAVYGLPANAAAVPLMAFLIMPTAALALFLMPLHLEYWPLTLMGIGIDWTLSIAHWAADLPYAVWRMAAWPLSAIACLVAGFLLLTLWRGQLRWLGVAPILLSFILIASYRQPDIAISPRFDVALYRAEDGSLQISGRQKERFVLAVWERLYGQAEGSAEKWPREGENKGMACDGKGCRLELKGYKVSFLKTPEIVAQECAWADLVLSFDPVRAPGCVAPVIDKFDALRNGAYGIWLRPDHIEVVNVAQIRGQRPWNKLNDTSAAD